MTKTILTLFVLLLTASTLTACNTIAGAGQDLSKAGSAVTRGAEKAGARK